MNDLSIAERLRQYTITNPGWSTIYIFSIIFLIVGLGCLLLPEIVYDQFVWRYFWGPVVADAEDRTVGGITEGYNIVSTLSYGIILAGAILVIYRLIVVLDIEMNKWFFLAVIPYILFGGFARALEDAMLFKVPGAYIFISPVIYVFTGLITVGLMIVSYKLSQIMIHIQNKIKTTNKEGIKWIYRMKLHRVMILYGGILSWISIIFLIIFNYWANYSEVNLLMILLVIITTLIFVVFHSMSYPELQNSMALFFGGFGIALFCIPAMYVGYWFTLPQKWLNIYLQDFNNSLSYSLKYKVTLRPEGLAIIIALALIATAVWAGAAYIISHKTKWKQAALFGSGVNLALVFGQFTDASATFIAIDYYSYWEKHVLPGFLIEVLDTAAVMFILKAIALFFAIYVLDIYLKDDLLRYRKIVPLIKIAVMVLGLAPGTRDMLRLAMGV